MSVAIAEQHACGVQLRFPDLEVVCWGDAKYDKLVLSDELVLSSEP